MKRRDFLTRAPVAMAATAAPVAAMAATANLPEPAENPALLALGAKLPKVEQAYHDALEKWLTAWAIWSPQWPLAPDPCCAGWGSGDLECDLREAGLQREGESYPRHIRTREEMERSIENARELLAKDDRRKRSQGKAFRRFRHEQIAKAELGLALLPGYLAEIDRIKRESGFKAIDRARLRTSIALFTFARKVLAEQSLTIEGVRIKARACAALNRMHDYDIHMADLNDGRNNRSSMAGLLGAALLEVI